jgi:hypothetical protein
MPIDNILEEKVFVVNANDMDKLIERVEPMNNGEVLLIRATMVE